MVELGKIKRNKLLLKDFGAIKSPVICSLCEREIPPNQMQAHHLIPKSKGGVQTQYLHSICHSQIHALFSETELAVHYNTVETLKEHPEFSKFIDWVKKKPITFAKRSRKSDRRK